MRYLAAFEENAQICILRYTKTTFEKLSGNTLAVIKTVLIASHWPCGTHYVT